MASPGERLPSRRVQPHAGPSHRWSKLALGIAVVVLLIVGYVILSRTGVLATHTEEPGLRDRIQALGIWGPLAVVCLMTAAIVFSPAPSAPIALAAGAAYGHLWGTVYILIGAQLGAMIAFGVARLMRPAAIARWLDRQPSLEMLGSQNTLMAVVFTSRLIPFISFDVVSYAAGLTPLAAWRFATATFAGIVPASFVLAHFGDEMATGEARRIAISVLLLGSLTLIPVAAGLVIRRHGGGSDDG